MPSIPFRRANQQGRAGDAPAAPARLTPAELQRWRGRVHRRFLEEIERYQLATPGDADALETQLQRALDGVSEGAPALSIVDQRRIIQGILDEIHGLGPLADLMLDPAICDILVNGPDDVWVDRNGRLSKTGLRFDDEAHLRRILDRLVTSLGKQLDTGSPTVEARLHDGSRLHAIIPPLRASGAVLSIRRFRRERLTTADLLAQGCLSKAMLKSLLAAVAARRNVVIAGGGGAGKTTLLNLLASHIPDTERVLVLEELAELDFPHPHTIRLQARTANQEGRGDFALRDLVRNALRMRADRIIVGEVRGAEVLDMLQAMTVGHEGSLTTVHANSAEQVLLRLETLALLAAPNLSRAAVGNMLASAVQLIVHIARLPDGRRRITSISELDASTGGRSGLRELFRYDPAGERSPARGPAA